MRILPLHWTFSKEDNLTIKIVYIRILHEINNNPFIFLFDFFILLNR